MTSAALYRFTAETTHLDPLLVTFPIGLVRLGKSEDKGCERGARSSARSPLSQGAESALSPGPAPMNAQRTQCQEHLHESHTSATLVFGACPWEQTDFFFIAKM